MADGRTGQAKVREDCCLPVVCLCPEPGAPIPRVCYRWTVTRIREAKPREVVVSPSELARPAGSHQIVDFICSPEGVWHHVVKACLSAHDQAMELDVLWAIAVHAWKHQVHPFVGSLVKCPGVAPTAVPMIAFVHLVLN